MKNVLIIDGAENCAYAIYAMTDDEFGVAFPGDKQNVEFIEDIVDRIGDDGVASLFNPVWKREVKKPNVMGIHGTIFYQLYWKKKFYPTKNDQEMVLALGQK
jgi:hypothetical protein